MTRPYSDATPILEGTKPEAALDWRPFTKCRFTGGPLYWRRRTGPGYRVAIGDQVQRIEVLGLVRQKGQPSFLTWRNGTYRRVASDRFKWVGWT